MSFRRYASNKPSALDQERTAVSEKLPSGIKPTSPMTLSTGTSTLDSLLSMPSGLPVSSVLLVEEDGTGNYSGVVLRQYVAQGVIQGDRVWIGGIGEGWWKGVPGLAKAEKSAKSSDTVKQIEEKMKIAWRYGINDPKAQNVGSTTDTSFPDFCNSFDISEQLAFPRNSQVVFSPPPAHQGNPYQIILSSLLSFLETSPKSDPVRLVLPDFLNPLVYNAESTNPSVLLRFLHTLVAIVHSWPYSSLLLSLSTSFYPRTQPLTSWIEHLCTHIIRLHPLPRATTVSAIKQPQGLVYVHKGGLMLKEMAYRVGRRGLVLEEWSLPPLEDDTPRVKQGFVIEKDAGTMNEDTSLISGVKKKDLEF